MKPDRVSSLPEASSSLPPTPMAAPASAAVWVVADTTPRRRRAIEAGGPLSTSSCDGCALVGDIPRHPERRDFLRAAAVALASLVALGPGATDAAALTPRPLRALTPHPGDRTEEKRYPIPATDGVSIDRDQSLIIARADNKAYAFSLSCPHQNTALRWDDSDHEFHCPKHKSRYRPDGTFIEGRATRAMDRLALRRDGPALVVDVDRAFQQDEQPNEWAAAFVAL